MAESYEYEPILREMLSRVPDTVDKREGSIIYDTLAPVALILAEQNFMLSYLFNLLFPDTAEGEWLDRCVSDFGLEREHATKALRQINVYGEEDALASVPIGSRFAVSGATFVIKEEISAGCYKAECEQEGTEGNRYSDEILPVDNMEGLARAELVAEPLIPARDEETDNSLRERFYRSIRQTPFGGNIADYEEKALSIEGVGAVKVYHASEVQPGMVGLIIGNEQGGKATGELIARVETAFAQEGEGLAPIGHRVRVKTATDFTVDSAVELRMKTGTSLELVKPIVEQTIRDYINGIGFTDEIVFRAKLTANVLNCHESILDVGAVTLNGAEENIVLTKTFDLFQLPAVGEITVTEVTA